MKRVVVVSGGGSGIGRACAAWFAERGDEVWIIGRREPHLKKAIELMKGDSKYIVADLSTVAGAESVQETLTHKKVDVIVCSAGGTAAAIPEDLRSADREWTNDLRQNLMTTVLLVEALRKNLQRPGGRIVGIGSIGAQLGSGYGGSYGAAKAALHGWLYWIAQELGPDGITANLVTPGFIPETEFFGSRMNADFYSTRVNRTVMKRAGTLEDVSETVGFLASPEAGYITGQIIGISGGTVFSR